MKQGNLSLPLKSALVVEDDPRWAEITCAILRLNGWDAVLVGSLGAARAALTHRPVQCLLLDLRLPDSTIEMSLAEIPRLKTLGAARVFIITGCDVTDELRFLARDCYADAVIPKDVKCFEVELRKIS